MLLVALAVGTLDGLVTYLGIKDREAWIAGDIRRALLVEGLITAALGVSICAFVQFTWIMILPSVAGSLIGRYAAWRF